ncbi:MAG TPA: NAD(P)-binding domain-containing protein [Aquabacterium sp.]|uniref:NAD(P)-binding domain-containing protein n=1 Tax=Aquabacterium sp. TaxID=1872578 RepID=UPI002E375193|nr:NAD(P)-binding domain-containing protein [Aquabacterium sp.]HEX5372737.1 NAD(P)-binding domain-containing protein [Aquabacterium sp.]
MLFPAYLTLYAGAAALAVGLHLLHRHRKRLAAEAALQASRQAGLHEPASLHPVVDPNRCFGSGACAKACPEQALGIVDGKATLINASACIGHGACVAACPTQALTLVFGTAERGVDIPVLTPTFESSVPGIFIAGELGGMGLIRKTAEQGRQAMRAIHKKIHTPGQTAAAPLDVVIVGAGPAGISAGLSALHHQLRYKIIEQEASLGGTVYHYPRNKIAMTAPVKLDLIGTMNLGTEVQKESLLSFWNDVVARTGLSFQLGERLEGVDRQDDGSFLVRTSKATYHTRTVLLSLGRRGSPRKLDVPGEEQAKVVYRLIDAEQYRDQHVLVVGGGDSALEAAIALAETPGTTVTLSYRSQAFSRVKDKNRQRLTSLEQSGRLTVMLQSTVVRIDAHQVTLNTLEGVLDLPNEAVIVCAGGVLPTPLLQSIGVLFETKHGTA